MVLVHRFGGWYSDLDFVFLRPLNEMKSGIRLRNVAASDGKDEIILNSIFHNTKNHVFLDTAFQMFTSTFKNGEWASSGPFLFSKTLFIV